MISGKKQFDSKAESPEADATVIKEDVTPVSALVKSLEQMADLEEGEQDSPRDQKNMPYQPSDPEVARLIYKPLSIFHKISEALYLKQDLSESVLNYLNTYKLQNELNKLRQSDAGAFEIGLMLNSFLQGENISSKIQILRNLGIFQAIFPEMDVISRAYPEIWLNVEKQLKELDIRVLSDKEPFNVLSNLFGKTLKTGIIEYNVCHYTPDFYYQQFSMTLFGKSAQFKAQLNTDKEQQLSIHEGARRKEH